MRRQNEILTVAVVVAVVRPTLGKMALASNGYYCDTTKPTSCPKHTHTQTRDRWPTTTTSWQMFLSQFALIRPPRPTGRQCSQAPNKQNKPNMRKSGPARAFFLPSPRWFCGKRWPLAGSHLLRLLFSRRAPKCYRVRPGELEPYPFARIRKSPIGPIATATHSYHSAKPSPSALPTITLPWFTLSLI